MDDERSPKSHPYFVPDYFLRFARKIGTCRTACCVGWPVSISQENYFRLLGVDCSTDLRRRLDCAMRMADYPTPECYAHFEHRYDGECALHLPDGRCALAESAGARAAMNAPPPTAVKRPWNSFGHWMLPSLLWKRNSNWSLRHFPHAVLIFPREKNALL